ncbi:MAG: LacI family DNA-binding transcriptional regulator [Micrococcales bacterium]|nr:LacI family DNA-binding transcriptional regulator [Micrococcales bacterium]
MCCPASARPLPRSPGGFCCWAARRPYAAGSSADRPARASALKSGTAHPASSRGGGVAEPSRSKPASIRDVAAQAGVSRQTVSRVLNRQTGMTEETAQRVRRAIADLDYQPNRAARILASSRHRTIGLITTAPTMFGPSSIALALELAAREHGYAITVVSTRTGLEPELSSALEELIRHGIDGLIVIAPQQLSWEVLQARLGSIPSITLQWRGGPAHTAYLDQHTGAEAATRHLIKLGHRRVLHLAGPEAWAEVEQRADGYRSALETAGLVPLPLVYGDWTADSGYAAGRELLPARNFTAVFASNDQMAIGLLHAARELGIDVPVDLSVVGFDDIPEARHAAPPLTTVRQEFGGLGEAAISRLIALIDGRLIVDDEVAGRTDLLVRESSGPPRAL